MASTKLTRRTFVAAAATALAAAGLAGCASDDGKKEEAKPADEPAEEPADEPAEEPAEEGGKTFTYAIAGDPGNNVNPVTTSDRFGLMTLKLLFSPLYVVRAEGIQWYLADSYDVSDDFLEYTFHLKEGVTWSDGEPVTADDVVFSYETIRETDVADAYSSLNYGDDGKIEVEAIDDLTVKFTFPFLNAAALETLQGPDGVWIFPRHVYGEVEDFENNDVNANPVGTGPFTLAEYQEGQYLLFNARKDYFDGEPKLDNLVFRIVTNENSGMQGIQTGEFDAWIATAAEVEQMDIEGNNLTVTPYTEGRVAYIVFNTKLVPNEDLRKAFFYSLDKEKIGQAAVLEPEYFEPQYTFLPFNSQFYNPDAVEKYERDLDKAAELLKASGETNPTFVLGYTGSDSLQTNASLLIQEQAAEAGITIELRGVESSALSQAMKDPDNKDYDIMFGGYIMGIDPDSYSSLFTSGSASNYAHYDNPVLDDLFAQGRIETDEAKRHEIYDAAQAELADHATQYPLYSNMRLLVTGPRVSGIDDAKLIPIYTFEDPQKLIIEE